MNIDLFVDRIQDVLVDYPDSPQQRAEIRVILIDVVNAVAKTALAGATTPPKGALLGTFTREKGVQP